MRSLDEAIEIVQENLAHGNPDLVTSEQAADLLEKFATIERLGSSGKLLYAERGCESGRWADEGHRSPACWMAEVQKSSTGEAYSALETSKSLRTLERTRDALKGGQLSESQAKQISMATGRDPSSEKELLKSAASDTIEGLKNVARQVMTRASSREDELTRYNAIKAARYVKHWKEYDGAVRLDAKLAPDDGARVITALEKRTNQIFESNREQGIEQSPTANRADAFVGLITGKAAPNLQSSNGSSSGASGGRASGNGRTDTNRTDTVVVRVDSTALRRGYAKGSETCEIAGVGRVPVATAERMLPESFLKIVVRDAVDVQSVCHVGRTVPAHVLTALEERDPKCVVPGCEVAHGLECHHWREDFAICKTTSLSGLVRVCGRHHDMISYEGFRIDGGPGKWRLIPPRAPDTG